MGRSTTIKNNKMILDFGNYLPPQLFNLNDRIYIALTDQQAQKVTLLIAKQRFSRISYLWYF